MIFVLFLLLFTLAIYKNLEFKVGLRLFKGLRLLFLPSVTEAKFIQGATFIPDSRVEKGRLSSHFSVAMWKKDTYK